MHEVFRDIDTATVGLISSLLEESGIQTLVRNWSGANITSIPIPDLYPNICVRTEEEAEQARQIIREYFEDSREKPPNWICPHCGETVDGNLAVCWSCQTPVDGV